MLILRISASRSSGVPPWMLPQCFFTSASSSASWCSETSRNWSTEISLAAILPASTAASSRAAHPCGPSSTSQVLLAQLGVELSGRPPAAQRRFCRSSIGRAPSMPPAPAAGARRSAASARSVSVLAGSATRPGLPTASIRLAMGRSHVAGQLRLRVDSAADARSVPPAGSAATSVVS